MKLRDDILTSPIDVNLQSTNVADEEQLFFLPDEEEESEQQIFARKALSKQRAIDNHAGIRNEQDSDPLLKALVLRTLHEEYDKHLLKTKPQGKILLRPEERIIMKDGDSCANTTEKMEQSLIMK